MAVALRDKVTNALLAVDQFSTLLETETEALKASDFDKFEILQDKKIELAQSYQDAILAFEEDMDVLPQLEELLKEKLFAAHARYNRAATENQETLLIKQKVSERILNLVMRAAKQTVMDTPSYGSRGIQAMSDKIPVHFKLNEVL
jgi:hypothetical protein